MPDKRRVVYSHDVVFNESCFPLKGTHDFFKDADEADYLADDPALYPELTTPDTSENLTPLPSSLDSNDALKPGTLSPSSATPDSIVPSGIVEGDQNFNSTLTPISDTQHPDQDVSHSDPVIKESHPVAGKNIRSTIDTANILPSRTRQSARLAFAYLSNSQTPSDPVTYHQAIS